MKTLETMLLDINNNLLDMIGNNITSILELYKTVRNKFQEGELYKELDSNGLKDLFVFKDDISEMEYIYLRASKETNILKKIIEIKTAVEYYDEGNISNGGVLREIKCEFIDVGKKIKNMPLETIVLNLQLTDLITKQNKIKEKINNLNDELNCLNNKYHENEILMRNLKSKLNLNEDTNL